MFQHTLLPMEHCKEQHIVTTTYGENYFKGGVYTQLCGWLGNEDLCGSAVGDSDYHADSGYLEEQRKFQESDLVGFRVIRFLNILD